MEIFDDCLSREHCTKIDDHYLKDMNCIKNVSFSDLIIIDNLISSFTLQLDNGIPIKPYIFGKNDQELEFIAKNLKGVSKNTDCAEYV